ncbi:hypothetical protein TFLX_01324 [Thermoflexales bacterium]|nr:hypothetical protein TFLX_01324 [Thermoflexales bacterium]
MDEKIVDPSRFERVDFAKRELWTPNWRTRSRLSKGHIGDFVSRIWALYGPPDSVGYEGFSCRFRDKETELVFEAFSAGYGPSYGAYSQDAAVFESVVDMFDALLKAATPADCEIEYETDFGVYRSGARNGIPFDEMVKKSKSEQVERKLAAKEVDEILDELF